MSRLAEHHRAKCGVEGKCSVPMWMGGAPSGFCDEPAYGEQYSEGTRHAPPHWSQRDRNGYYFTPHPITPPFAMGLCCSRHGGPSAEAIRLVRDGDMFCAFRSGFENLQESIAGFGRAQTLAERDLIQNEQAAPQDITP
jgi:hypothetical protein